jgi:competence protein ComEC
MSAQFMDYPAMQDHLAAWGLSTGDVLWLARFERVKVGKFTFAIEDPVLQPGANDNEGSMFIHAACGPASAVFSGDADGPTEVAESSAQPWTSQVMKVGHHGSKTSTAPAWLAAVHPEYAVISCGRDNVYGHPSRSTVSRLNSFGAQVFRTDQQGDVEFGLDPKLGFVPMK